MTDDKAALRTQLLAARRTLNMAVLSSAICQQIEEWPLFQTASWVLTFRAKAHEIDLWPLMLAHPDKSWHAPRVISEEAMTFHRASENPADWLCGAFGLDEPRPDLPELDLVTHGGQTGLILLPALAVAMDGTRLGHGKGYYDRFLAHLDLTHWSTLCPVPESLLQATLPADPWDIPADWIVTENRILSTRR